MGNALKPSSPIPYETECFLKDVCKEQNYLLATEKIFANNFKNMVYMIIYWFSNWFSWSDSKKFFTILKNFLWQKTQKKSICIVLNMYKFIILRVLVKNNFFINNLNLKKNEIFIKMIINNKWNFLKFQYDAYSTAFYRIYGENDQDEEEYNDHIIEHLIEIDEKFERIFYNEIARDFHYYDDHSYDDDDSGYASGNDNDCIYDHDCYRQLAKGAARFIHRKILPWAVCLKKIFSYNFTFLIYWIHLKKFSIN